MSISSSATGLRPGVCTSTTRPTTPYTGQIIYETNTGYLRVWDGANWDYLSQSQDGTTNLPISAMGQRATFTPTWTSTGTQPALGNGTFVGEWVRVQNLVMVTYNLLIGSTTTFGTGNYLFSYPTAASTNIDVYQMQGWGNFADSSTGLNYVIYALYNNGATDKNILWSPTSNAFLSSTVPVTWAVGDNLRVKVVYCGA